MQLFDVPATMTNGSGDPMKSVLTTSMYIYNQGFKSHNYGYASMVSVGLFLIIAVLSIFALQTMQKKESEND
jgi:multiple sugar transport system permease protein